MAERGLGRGTRYSCTNRRRRDAGDDFLCLEQSRARADFPQIVPGSGNEQPGIGQGAARVARDFIISLSGGLDVDPRALPKRRVVSGIPSVQDAATVK